MHEGFGIIVPEHLLGKVGKGGKIRKIGRQITAVHVTAQTKRVRSAQRQKMLRVR